MPAVIVKHRVADFAAWLSVFEAHAAVRQAAGFYNTAVWQVAGDPASVVIYMENDSLDGIQTFAASEDLRERMQQGGVIGTPQFILLETGHKYLY